jgi:transposase
MLLVHPQVRGNLCTVPVDLRTSFDGSSGLVQRVFQQSLLEGHSFLFLNPRRDRLKMLWRDREGLPVWYVTVRQHHQSRTGLADCTLQPRPPVHR